MLVIAELIAISAIAYRLSGTESSSIFFTMLSSITTIIAVGLILYNVCVINIKNVNNIEITNSIPHTEYSGAI